MNNYYNTGFEHYPQNHRCNVAYNHVYYTDDENMTQPGSIGYHSNNVTLMYLYNDKYEHSYTAETHNNDIDTNQALK